MSPAIYQIFNHNNQNFTANASDFTSHSIGESVGQTRDRMITGVMYGESCGRYGQICDVMLYNTCRTVQFYL